jgi:hypothetical protein
MAQTKRKPAKPPPQTSLSPEGFSEPLHIDAVPWRKVSAASTAFKRLGRYGGGSQVGVGIDVPKPGQYCAAVPCILSKSVHLTRRPRETARPRRAR